MVAMNIKFPIAPAIEAKEPIVLFTISLNFPAISLLVDCISFIKFGRAVVS